MLNLRKRVVNAVYKFQGKEAPTVADLGSKNTMKYCPERKRWIDVNDEEGEKKKDELLKKKLEAPPTFQAKPKAEETTASGTAPPPMPPAGGQSLTESFMKRGARALYVNEDDEDEDEGKAVATGRNALASAAPKFAPLTPVFFMQSQNQMAQETANNANETANEAIETASETVKEEGEKETQSRANSSRVMAPFAKSASDMEGEVKETASVEETTANVRARTNLMENLDELPSSSSPLLSTHQSPPVQLPLIGSPFSSYQQNNPHTASPHPAVTAAYPISPIPPIPPLSSPPSLPIASSADCRGSQERSLTARYFDMIKKSETANANYGETANEDTLFAHLVRDTVHQNLEDQKLIASKYGKIENERFFFQQRQSSQKALLN